MEKMASKLYKAAASGDVAALKEMHNQKIDVLAQVSPGGNTALHISAYHGNLAFVKLLLQLMNEKSDEEATNEERRHSFLRAQNKEENVALHEAVKGGDHAQIVEELIKADAELSGIRNSKGESALFTASASGRLNALKKLLGIRDSLYYSRFDGQTCLHPALFYKKYGVVEELIEKVPELCQRADYFLGNTPLHIAALRGCPQSVVEKLLKCDPCSPFNQNKIKQQTALHVAAQYGHEDVVKCILKFTKSCIEIRDINGRTALHYAVENAQTLVVRSLVLAMDMVINTADNNGHTALDIAIQHHSEEPLSPYFGIRWFLRRKNAIAGVEAENQRREISKPFPSEERYSTTINSLSVCAILIATVTFQASFTLPHEFEGNGHGKKGSTSLSALASRASGDFEGFVIFDTLAFCLSIVAAILLAYANFLRHNRSWAVTVSAIILPFALYMTMVSFSLTILLQLREEHYALAYSPYWAMAIMGSIVFVVTPLVVFYALGCPLAVSLYRCCTRINSVKLFGRCLFS